MKPGYRQMRETIGIIMKKWGLMDMILTVTLNPAVDKTYTTGALMLGQVNRMRTANNIAGGKGINVAKILRQYGYDVMVTGFDNSPVSPLITPPLTTVDINTTDMGKMAARQIISRIANPALPYSRLYLQTQVLFRESASVMSKEWQ